MINNEFYSLLCGKLLGDGYLLSRKNARLQFRHTTKDRQYVLDQLERLKKHISFGPNNPAEYRYTDSRTGKTYTTLICQSKMDPRLTQLKELWYPRGQKIVPFQFVQDHLDPLALSIWYQDDGNLKNERRLILSTESFSEEENLFLIRLLKERFLIEASVDTQRRIDISGRKDVELFLLYVSPFLSVGMNRKSLNPFYEKLRAETESLLLSTDGKEEMVRTTIYVPFHFKK
ncbi:hypothetical protein CULT_410052 [[Clostridium] ultunense Esp]|nr:hypothetical protein CULT_410052 [[Clostridium] ultunense Esp]